MDDGVPIFAVRTNRSMASAPWEVSLVVSIVLAEDVPSEESLRSLKSEELCSHLVVAACRTPAKLVLGARTAVVPLVQ